MTSHLMRMMALFLGIAMVFEPVIPCAAQEIATTPTAQVAAAESQDGQIDAPSATLQNQQSSSEKAEQSPVAQTQDPPAGTTPQQSQSAAQVTTSGPPPQTSPTQTPQGAAAAQVQPTTGTAASKPAGAALAPPKQRRVRSFLIKFGAIAGAGIALGTVYALSAASPSKPPGSH